MRSYVILNSFCAASSNIFGGSFLNLCSTTDTITFTLLFCGGSGKVIGACLFLSQKVSAILSSAEFKFFLFVLCFLLWSEKR